jgi:hypothetical protein
MVLQFGIVCLIICNHTKFLSLDYLLVNIAPASGWLTDSKCIFAFLLSAAVGNASISFCSWSFQIISVIFVIFC